jgi:hypothetical protein
MKQSFSRAFLLIASLVCLGRPVAGGTVTGVVRNGTNGTPAANADVLLLALQSGMETVANTKTDAQGRYRLENPAIGTQPMLIRVIYRGVNFHQPLPPGQTTADVEVFQPTTNPKAIQVPSRVVVLQPNGETLLVGEEFTIRNETKPPAAYYKPDGNFEFQLPDGAQLSQVSSWGPSGMPTVQGTMDKGRNRYAIAFPFRPGESGVRIAYQVPYPASRLSLKTASPYAAARVTLIAPPSVQISSPGFAPAGTEQGMSLYARDSVPANAPFEISVSGTAPMPSVQGDQPDAVNGRETGVPVQSLPGRMDNLKWVFIGGFGALFALGAIYLWRRPLAATVPAPATAQGSAAPPPTPGPRSKPPKKETRPAQAEIPAGEAVAEVERQVTHSLDELKDTLFRLELRRQAGTISEEDYARERSRAEKILRDLVRG